MGKISNHCPDVQSFWELIKTHFLHATRNDSSKEITAFYVTQEFWDYHKEMDYWQTWEMRIGKIGVQLAGDLEWLFKKEQLHKQVFGDISKWWKTYNIRTTEKGKGNEMTEEAAWNNEVGQSISGKYIVGINDPRYQGIILPAKTYGPREKSDQLQTTMDIKSGRRVPDPKSLDGKGMTTEPDFSSSQGSNKGSEKSHFHKDRTVDTQEQPLQKLSQILRTYKMFEFNISDLWSKYEWHFHGFSYPQGRLEIDPYTGFFTWKDRVEIEEESIPASVRKKRRAKEEDSGVSYLTFDQWEQRYKDDAGVEETMELENMSRYLEWVTKQVDKTHGGTKEGYERIANYMKNIIEAFERPVIWSTLETFDRIMGRPPHFNDGEIIGFHAFKRELRSLVESVNYYVNIGKVPPQTYYCLLGKPGVGKTEIVKKWAKAWSRSYNLITYNGAQYLKILSGSPPTYKGADVGGIAQTFIEKRCDIKITREDLEREIQQIKYNRYNQKNKTNLTERQKKRIKAMEEILNKFDSGDLKEENYTEARLSSAPIIIIDEYEKAKADELKEKVGVLFDPGTNDKWMDEFLGHPLNLGGCFFVSTANWRFKNGMPTFPDFVDSRLSFVNVDLLTFQQRIEIAKIFIEKIHVYDFFPAYDNELEVNGKKLLGIEANKILKERWGSYDPEKDSNDEEKYPWTKRQKLIVDLFDDPFIQVLIDEQWGVRGVIQNIISTIKFLIILITRGKTAKGQAREDMGAIGFLEDLGKLSNPAFLIEKKGDCKTNGTIYITLTYRFDNGDGTKQEVTLDLTHARNVDLERDDDGNQIEAEKSKEKARVWVRTTAMSMTEERDEEENLLANPWRTKEILGGQDQDGSFFFPNWWKKYPIFIRNKPKKTG